MQEVSSEWKEQHKRTLLNESFVEVSLYMGDTTALDKVKSVTDNGSIYISTPSQIADGEDNSPTPYCTLEQNLWCLDGSRKAIGEEDVGDNSYISTELSDETCLFRRLPVITIEFSESLTKITPGITITWSKTYGEYASVFTIVAYKGNNIVAEKNVMDNKAVTSAVFVDIEDYNKIDIIVNKWCLPHHRARLEEVTIGLTKVYSKGDLFAYSHSQSVDPISTSLPKNEIKFSLGNANGEYNPHNPNGIAKYLMERQAIKVRYGLKMDDKSIEWVKGGTFYLSEWYARQNDITAEFTARDVLEFMSAVRPAETSLRNRTLKYLAKELLEEAKIPAAWVIAQELDEITTLCALPEDTYGNLLQLVANAGQCVIYQDREGVLRIERLTDSVEEYKINSFNSFARPETTLSKPVKQLKIKYYTYSSATSATSAEVGISMEKEGEIITIDNPLVTSKDRAESIGEWLKPYFEKRASVDVNWRVDPRLDALDVVKSENVYNSNNIRMTEVEFNYNGAFTGTGKGKVI